MSNISIEFGNPWVLLLLIPAIILALIPYFRLKKNRRRVRNKVVSLSLHMIIILLITLTCADMKFIQKNNLRTNDTIILVDASRSSMNSKEKIDKYIKETLENSTTKNRVGIVTFANECEYVAKLSSNYEAVYANYINARWKVKDNATNIEDALIYVEDILKDTGGRIVVLTDGLETDGNALIKASEMSNNYYQIDTLLFDNTPFENEVQITTIDTPDNVMLNEEISIDVVIGSNSNAMCSVALEIDGSEVEKRQLFVNEQETRVEFKYTFSEAKMYTISAKLDCETDTISENNVYYSYVNITLDNRVLIIDGTGSESTKLNALLESSYQVDVRNVDNLDVNLNDYKEVILMNASMETLPTEFDEKIKQYVISGGNLLTTGGKNTYHNGKMENTAFEDVLPITMDKDNMAPIGVMFLIDASGSMKETLPGSTLTRLELAKEAVIKSVNSMRNCDYAGVVSFNSSATVEIGMTPLTRKTEIINSIKNITIRTGTYYAKALEAASKELLAFDKTDIKHLIFMSDGTSNDTGYTSYVASMYQKGITCSTIAMGTSIDASELERMANLGGGNFYSVNSASSLGDIMIKETESLQSDFINEESIRPIIKLHNSTMKGITTLPNIDGYVGVTSKASASVVLQANNDPLYVEWNYESNRVRGGKVASFMSDLSGEWTSAYFTDNRGIKFINNIVSSLLITTNTRTELSVRFNEKNFQNVLVVNTPSVEGIGTLKASITYPDNSKRVVDLSQTASSVYSSIIPNYGEQAGVYQVEVVKTVGSKITTEVHYVTFSYSDEFNVFADKSEVLKFAEQLANNGRGKLYTLNEDIMNEETIQDEQEINPQTAFLIVALVLFLLDIMARKFNFKWPHELIKNKSIKNSKGENYESK